MAIIMRLVAKFNSYYAQKPLLTTMITNAILGGIADTTAQSITAARHVRGLSLPKTNTPFISSDGVELDDFNEKTEQPPPRPTPIHLSPSGPPPFDFERLTRFMSYGFLMSPIQFKWYGFLNRTFPVTSARSLLPALQRVAFDQLIFAPFGLTCFFTFMTLTEGGGLPQIKKKFLDVYVPTLRANYILWPAVQMVNFRLMPIQFQIPFVSTVGIAWTAYLSLTNSSEDVEEESMTAGSA
jgi:hypothetical protein